MAVFMIVGAIIGLILGGFQGAIICALAAAALRQFVFRKFWV